MTVEEAASALREAIRARLAAESCLAAKRIEISRCEATLREAGAAVTAAQANVARLAEEEARAAEDATVQ